MTNGEKIGFMLRVYGLQEESKQHSQEEHWSGSSSIGSASHAQNAENKTF